MHLMATGSVVIRVIPLMVLTFYYIGCPHLFASALVLFVCFVFVIEDLYSSSGLLVLLA